ncbi:YbaB/EbfC family nucleoid-associated protein [Streptomyces sp. BK340]|uniref:YbaB/EbfC family nucleoid-associated protein n=1 Tax=Streptomyces sp. BK340 TaxID=2572903 RepID=UPI0011A9A670|nr:YbaB/EbfC family nucleoid-associated protein [Streptomyces sp. BK340]TVZ90348.1 YbaB/EbfC DNA-binding family protein [Streptomyces sp. BK340]
MTSPFAEQIGQIMANLAEKKSKLESVSRELQEATASATSKDRMVTAKVGPQGQVVSLTFHTTDYSAMAPAELSAVLVNVLNEARAQMGEKVIEAFRPFEDMGQMLGSSMTGGQGLEELLAPLRAMRPGAENAKPQPKRQEEFNG